MADQPRVQTPDLQAPEQLNTPNFSGLDTYAKPEAPVIDNNLAHIADALGSFNSDLTKYGTIAARAQKMQQSQTEMEAARGAILGMTHPQYMEAWKNGTLPSYSLPAPNMMIGKVAGRYAADEVLQGIQQKVANGEIDLSATNPDGTFKYDLPSMVTQQAQDILKPYQGSSDFRAHGYVAGVYERLENQRETLLKYQDGVRNTQMVQALGGAAQTAFQDAITTAKDPQSAAEAVRGLYGALGPNLPIKQKNPMLDTQLLAVAKQLANDPRYVDSVQAILTSPRKDPATGQDIPALMTTGKTSPERAAALMDLQQTITKTQDTKVTTDANNKMTDMALQAMKNQDPLALSQIQPRFIELPSKKTVEVGADAQKNAATQYFQWSQDEAQQSGRRTDDVLDREIKVAQNAGVTIPHIEQAMKNTVQGALNSNLSTDTAAQGRVLDQYQQYRYIKSQYGGWADTHLNLDKDTKTFFNAMDVLTRGGFADDKTAMTVAAGLTNNKDALPPDDLKKKMEEISSSVKGIVNDGSWTYRVLGSSAPGNLGLVQQQVEQYAKLIGRSANVDAKTAVDVAKNYVAATMMQTNGSALPRIPQLSDDEMRTQINKQLDAVMPALKQRLPYQGMSKSDIGLQQMPDNSIRMIDKRTWLPIMLPTKDQNGNVTKGVQQIYPQQLIDGRDADRNAAYVEAKKQLGVNSEDALRKAWDDLDYRERGLKGSGLGGEFFKAQMGRINSARAKLPPRPADRAPVTPPNAPPSAFPLSGALP